MLPIYLYISISKDDIDRGMIGWAMPKNVTLERKGKFKEQGAIFSQ